MSPESQPARGPGSFNPDTTSAIVEAALSDLAEKGFTGMSMDGVARRAGVGKSAIYRRWSSKEQMTSSILRELGWTPDVAVPDTGSLRADLRVVALDFVRWLTDDPRVGQIFLAVLAESRRSSKLADVLTTDIDRPRRARVAEVFDQAVARGEIAVDHDRELAMDILGGTLFWHQLARRHEVTPAYVEHLLDVLEAGWQR